MSEPIPKSGFVAHTPNSAGQWHSLREHIEDVTRTAEAFASAFGGGELARIAGMLHDLGKYSDGFQAYLWDCHLADLGLGTRPKPRSAPHKQAGAAHIAPANMLLAVTILGHHGKIPDLADSQQICGAFDPEALAQLLKRASADGLQLPDGSGADALVKRLASDRISAELLARMVYSCLVDADSLDTEEHHDPTARALRAPKAELSLMAEVLRNSQMELGAAADQTPVNTLRREVHEACVAAAAGRPGVYRLTVPTGGGKTRSSLDRSRCSTNSAASGSCTRHQRRVRIETPQSPPGASSGRVAPGISAG